MKLRQREEESFILFRKSLNDAIEEFLRQGNSIDDKTAKIIYRDIIKPKLAAMDKKVKLAKKDLISDAFRSTVACVGAISFGTYLGLSGSNLGPIVTALGGMPMLYSGIKNLMAGGDAEKTVRNEDLYFLWKILKKKK